MTYEEYRSAVIDTARFNSDLHYICTDSVRESFNTNKTVEEAAEIAADDTILWEMDADDRYQDCV